MWVEEVENGKGKRYKFCERYTCPLTGKYKKVSITYNTNNRQVIKIATQELQVKIDEAIKKADYSDAKLMDLMWQFLNYRKPFEKEATTIRKTLAVETIGKMVGGDILVSALSVPMLQEAFNDFYNNHSYSYTTQTFSFLAQTLRFAKRMRYISDISFLDDIEILKKPKTETEVIAERSKCLDRQELQTVLSKLKAVDPRVSMICEFQSLTGLRFGELAALRIQDYSKKKKIININGSLSWKGSIKSKTARTSPKNAYSFREVTLDARAIHIIEYFILANKARKMWKQSSDYTDYIFTTDGGNPFTVQFINKTLKKIGHNKPLSTHIFRHTHISLLAEQNVPLKAIMQRVGHNEPRTTLAVYTHVTEEMQKELNKAITKIGNITSK